MNHLEAHMCVLQELNDAIACMGTLNPKIRKRGLCHVRASKHEIERMEYIENTNQVKFEYEKSIKIREYIFLSLTIPSALTHLVSISIIFAHLSTDRMCFVIA